jgi:hypothetical protein
MGIVNVITGLNDHRETYLFNGVIRENLNLNWEYTKIFKGSEELTPDYPVQEDDVIFLQEYPGAGIGILGVLGILSLAAGVGVGVYAAIKANQAQKELNDALERMRKQNKKQQQKKDETIPWLSGGKNEKADGKQAPIILGRHLFTPYFLSDPYLKPSGVDGDKLYWYGAFLCGQSGLCIEKIRNGTTVLVETNDESETKDTYTFMDIGELSEGETGNENEIEVIQGGWFEEDIFNQKWTDSLDSSVEIGRKQKDNAEPDGIFIEDDGEEPVIRETAPFPMRAEIELFVDGLCEIKDGKEKSASVELCIAWSTDKKDWKKIDFEKKAEYSQAFNYDKGYNFDTIVENQLDYFDVKKKDGIRQIAKQVTGTYNGELIKSITFVKRYGIDTIHGTIDVCYITIFKAEGGSYDYGNNLSNRTLPYDLTFQYLDNKTGVTNIAEAPDRTVITGAKSKQMRFIASVDFPKEVFSTEGSPIYIKATRLNRMHINGYKDRIYLNAIRTLQYSPKESTSDGLVAAKNLNPRLADKFCRMGVKIKVNKNTEHALDKFNIVASMTGKVWEGSGWSDKKVKTGNPAAVALEVLTGLIHEKSRYNKNFYDDEIDLDSFKKLFVYCEKQSVKIEGDGVHQGGTHPLSLEANGVITGAAKKLDVLKSVLATCDAGLYVNEFGRIIAYYDHGEGYPIGLLNPQRIVKMAVSRNLDEKASGYRVEFIDEKSDWSIVVKNILRPRVQKDPGNTYTNIKFDYTTNYYQAMWLARRMMAKEILRPGETKVIVGKEGRYYKPGSLIKVQHEGFKHGIGSGEIIELIRKENGDITGFRLMERFDISKDRDYYIDYHIVTPAKNHVPQTRQIQSVGEYTNVLMLTTPIPADSNDIPVMGNVLSVIDDIRTPDVTVRESLRYLVSDMSETAQGYELALVPYDEEIYNTTLFDEIPEYRTSIIAANPKVFAYPETRPYDGRNGIDGQYTDYRFAVNTSVDTAPDFDANADNPGDIWKDVPPVIASAEYLWMIQADWRGATRITSWSPPTRISGPIGDTGNYYASIYTRSVERPAVPTGDNPPLPWADDPSNTSGLYPLWMSRGVKNASGVLQGAWSIPVQISGEDGLGINDIPRDAYAYWSCDDLSDEMIIDNSGNKRHIKNVYNMRPAKGKFGKGLLCLSGGYGAASGILNGHTGDFAVSVWTNKPANILGKRGSGYSMGFGIRGGRAYFISNSPNAELYAGTAFVDNGQFHHLVVMVKNKVLSLYVDGQLSGETNIASAYTKPLDYHNFIIGGLLSSESELAPCGTVIDEIAVFDRALTEKEIEALSLTTLQRFYTLPDWMIDPDNPLNIAQEPGRYRGVYTTVDTGDTGYIGSDRMNHEDYVMYTGANTGTGSNCWLTNYMYQWDAVGKKWTRLARPTSSNVENASKYWEAIPQMTKGAIEQVISTAFINSLVGNEAFIKYLFANIIELNDKGIFHTTGFKGVDGGVPGVRITAATGLLEAFGAILKSIQITGDSLFEGTLKVGNVWNKNGGVANANARSSFLALNRDLTGDNRELRVKDLDAYGVTRLGKTDYNFDGVDNRIIMYGDRIITDGTRTSCAFHSGDYTAKNLFDLFERYLKGNEDACLINGNVSYYNEGKYNPVFLTYASRNYSVNGVYIGFQLFGAKADANIIIQVTSTNILIVKNDVRTPQPLLCEVKGTGYVRIFLAFP